MFPVTSHKYPDKWATERQLPSLDNFQVVNQLTGHIFKSQLAEFEGVKDKIFLVQWLNMKGPQSYNKERLTQNCRSLKQLYQYQRY